MYREFKSLCKMWSEKPEFKENGYLKRILQTFIHFFR